MAVERKKGRLPGRRNRGTAAAKADRPTGRPGARGAGMHELAYVETLLSAVAESARERGVRRVTRVQVAVGELAGLNPEALAFAFAVLAPAGGPLLADAVLAVERRPARARCPACGDDFAVPEHGLRCPSCGDGRGHMYQGGEFLLTAYEGER